MTTPPDEEIETGRRRPIVPRNAFGASDHEADRSVERGSPKLEHSLFVILGAIATIAVFLDAVGVL